MLLPPTSLPPPPPTFSFLSPPPNTHFQFPPFFFTHLPPPFSPPCRISLHFHPDQEPFPDSRHVANPNPPPMFPHFPRKTLRFRPLARGAAPISRLSPPSLHPRSPAAGPRPGGGREGGTEGGTEGGRDRGKGP